MSDNDVKLHTTIYEVTILRDYFMQIEEVMKE